MKTFVSKHLIWLMLLAAGIGGKTGYDELTRENSTFRHEMPKVLTMPNGNKTLIREALVWGDPTTKIDPQLLLWLWWSEPRGDVPAALMLAKAERESGFHPFVARYEIGCHQVLPQWLSWTEMQATSFGLFQILGKNYPDSLKHHRGMLDVPTQMTQFASFMGKCDSIQKLAPPNGKDRIYRMIACYGQTSKTGATNINALTEDNYRCYKKWDSLLYQPGTYG